MTLIIKIVLSVLMLAGAAIVIFGAFELWDSIQFAQHTSGRTTGEFLGYHREVHQPTRIPSANDQDQHEESYAIASYPEFRYRAADGSEQRVREQRVHLFELYKPGEKVEILLSPSGYGDPRLAGFYALYLRDIAVLGTGLAFILAPMLIWYVVMSSLANPEVSSHFNLFWDRVLGEVWTMKVGFLPVRYILIFFAGFMLLGLLIAGIAGLAPYVAQLHFGSGGRLIEALERGRFEEARELITKDANLNATNQYNQNPLLLALEAAQPELARLLIEAGAEVNIKSKMLQTPLRVATQSGDLAMVQLLLAKGADPDAPEDESPPVAYALADKRYDIARALIEGGTDLQRGYRYEGKEYTVGDLTVLAKQPELIALVRQRGGRFTE